MLASNNFSKTTDKNLLLPETSMLNQHHVLRLDSTSFLQKSNNPKGRAPRAMPVGEWKLARRALSEARKVEQGATGSARRVST